ncbi:DUF6069 family protein [Actinoplanes sp. CA-051413]|uniref:DUF6069 family protein n=1 Tax=Actinoplanes sp. CA-051413 TaxID=3239899 RepID=UPI003D96B8F1
MRSGVLVIAAAAGAAVLINLILYGIGRAAGGSFRFTTPTGPAEVDGVTVAAFSALPLLAGLVAVALLSRFGAWVTRTALIVGPLLAVATIFAMTLPTDLDATSKVTLALCHLVLVPIIIVAVRLLGRRAEVAGQIDVVTGPA